MAVSRSTLTGLVMLMALPATAFADAEPQPLGSEYCFPTANITETLSKFESLKPEKRDIVAASMSFRIELDEGEALPERVEIRDKGSVHPIAFDADNRAIDFMDPLRASSDEAEFCVVDPAREGRFYKDVGYKLDFGMRVGFLKTPGYHTLDEIEEALKDGRSHYKKMVGAMGFMVPKFTHISVAGDDEANPPIVFATAGRKDLGEPEFEAYQGARMIALKTLEEMDADGIRIEGDYRISPSPDAETIAKFSGED